MHDAVEACSHRVVDALLDAGAEPDLTSDGCGCSSLYLAVRRGDTRVVASLLRNGATADFSSDSSTPLVAAALSADTSMAALLLDAVSVGT